MKRIALLVVVYWISAIALTWVVGSYIVAHLGWYAVPFAVPFISLLHTLLLPRLYISVLKKEI